MTGRLLDISRSLDGRQRVTLELEQDFLQSFQELRESLVDVEIRKHRKKRSRDANAYFWELAGKLSAVLRIPPKELYRQYIPDVGGNYETIPVKESMLLEWEHIWSAGHAGRITEDMGPCRNTPGYHNVRCYIGSSDYNTAQMSRLIDLIVADCKEQGIETLPPDKLEAMKERWK